MCPRPGPLFLLSGAEQWPEEAKEDTVLAPGALFLLRKAAAQLQPHVLGFAERVVTIPSRRVSETPTRGAASGQVVQVYFWDWVSPVAEGTELWTWEGGILFLIKKWEHMFYELAQPVIR